MMTAVIPLNTTAQMWKQQNEVSPIMQEKHLQITIFIQIKAKTNKITVKNGLKLKSEVNRA